MAKLFARISNWFRGLGEYPITDVVELASETVPVPKAKPTTAEAMRRAVWELLADLYDLDVNIYDRLKFVNADPDEGPTMFTSEAPDPAATKLIDEIPLKIVAIGELSMAVGYYVKELTIAQGLHVIGDLAGENALLFDLHRMTNKVFWLRVKSLLPHDEQETHEKLSVRYIDGKLSLFADPMTHEEHMFMKLSQGLPAGLREALMARRSGR